MPVRRLSLDSGSVAVTKVLEELEADNNRIVSVTHIADGVIVVYERKPGRPKSPKQETR